MKLTYKHRMTIVVAIAALFIVFGLAQAVFKFQVDKTVIDQASFILMMIAAALFLTGRGKKAKVDSESEKEENKEENQ